jgi:hypothetical protein
VQHFVGIIVGQQTKLLSALLPNIGIRKTK